MKIIFTNAKGISLDEMNPFFDTIVVDGETIEAVGTNDLIAGYPEGALQIIDLGGKTILPGFIDTHQHLEMTGKILCSADLSSCTKFDDVFALIREQRSKVADGEWVLAYCLFDQNLAENRMPTAAELDAVCADSPVALIHTTLHFLSLNTLGIEALGIKAEMEGVDVVAGEATGVVRDPASFKVALPQINKLTPKETILKGFDLAARAAIKRGITCLHCLEGKDGEEERAVLFHQHQKTLPIHTVFWNQTRNITASTKLDLNRIGGCVFADGAIDCYTAALFEPYCNQPDNYGALTYTQEEMDDFVIEAHRQGLQVAVHCEADRSIEQVLHSMEKALALYPRENHRHRIEHFEVPTYGQIERMAKAGIIASMQPAFFPYLMKDQNLFEAMLGPSRHKRLHPYRTILDAGITICGGSDSPVTPYDPLAGIQAAICHPYEPERVNLTEALQMFTTAAAYSVFEENERGCLKKGMKAEFIILDQNPYSVAPEKISKITIEQVFAKGTLHKTEDL